MPSIDSANMNGSLIRAHMAKMMVNYAEWVLWLSPDTSLSCMFTDIANQSTELQWYITQACQLGLMGQGITAFKPNDLVNRAQFGTVLSRALYGDIYNGSDPYYKDHLAALKDAAIMTQIDVPAMTEIRWYVMLMMMRAVPTDGSISLCEETQNQFYCSIGLELCPSECLPLALPSAGTLSLSKITKDISDSFDATYLGSLQFLPSSDSILLTSITAKIDLWNSSSTQAWLEQDGVRITAKKAPSSDGTTVLSFFPSLTIKKWSSVTLDVFTSTSVKSLTITNTSNITSSASSVGGSFPIVLK